MRLVRVESVREPMELARDIPAAAADGAPLLRRGVRLSTGMVRKLAARGVRAVWVEDDLGDGIVPYEPLPDHVRRSTESALRRCLNQAADVSKTKDVLPPSVVAEMQEAAGEIIEALAGCPQAALAFDDLATADSYTHSHSVRVTTLGMVLGQWVHRHEGWRDWKGRRRYDRISERMGQLALGLLLHDIGKIAIPTEILNKPGQLEPAEWELVKTHPQAGASMLPRDTVSPLTTAVVRDHHERWDGLGYPKGKRAEETHTYARIAAVADVYDAVTADRPYKPATPPYVGVKVIREGAGTQFDPHIVQHFLRLVMPYPVGYTLTLPDGRAGAVASVDPDRPDHPLVRYRNRSGQVVDAEMHVVDGEVLAVSQEMIPTLDAA